MALGSTQPLTEMSTGAFPGGKGGRCVKLITLPSSCAVVMKSGNLNFLKPSGPLQACKGNLPLPLTIGTVVAQWLRCCSTNRKVAGSITAGVIDIKSFRSHFGPGVDSAFNRNEYQEHFLGVKAAGA